MSSPSLILPSSLSFFSSPPSSSPPITSSSSPPSSPYLLPSISSLLPLILPYIPSWSSNSPSSIEISRLTGFSNLVFKLSNNDPTVSPKCLIYREYLSSNTFVTRQQEQLIFNYLSSTRLGPKNLGGNQIFRLEEFVFGTHPSSPQMNCREMMVWMARALAKLHKLKIEGVELKKEEGPKMRKELEKGYFVRGFEKRWDEIGGSMGETERERMRNMYDVVQEERSWIMERLPGEEGVVFCHNDLCANNIFIREEGEGVDQVVLIDFEYAGYNYRAYDIANFFNETTFDYSNCETPFFFHSMKDYPDDHKMKEFAAFYLFFSKTKDQDQKTWEGSIFEKTGDNIIEEMGPEFKEEVEVLVQEIKVCILFSLMYWMMWSGANCKNEKIDFDYIQHGYDRMTMYKSLKERFF